MHASNSANASANGGCGFLGLLTLIFIVLKLTGFIHWSWWWVLAPSWICLVLILLTIIGVVIYLFISEARKLPRRR